MPTEYPPSTSTARGEDLAANNTTPTPVDQWPGSLVSIRPELESVVAAWTTPSTHAWLLNADGTIVALSTDDEASSGDADDQVDKELEHVRCPINEQWSIVAGGIKAEDSDRFKNSVKLISRLARNQADLDATVVAAIEATDELVALQRLVAIQVDALDDTTLATYIAKSTNAMTKAGAVVVIDENGERTTAGTDSVAETLSSYVENKTEAKIYRAEDGNAPFDYVVKPLANNLATIAIAGLPGVRMTTPQLRHLDSVAGHATGLLKLSKQQKHLVERAVIDRDAEAAALMAAQVLPEQVPTLDGYQTVARCEPARMAAGDFYQFIRTEDRLVAVIGDVSGKGLAAAMVMGMVASHTHQGALERPKAGAAELLAAINDATYDYLTKVGRFVTLAVVIYNSTDNTVSICNAGHSPLLLATKQPESYNITAIEADAPPLGVLETLQASATSHTLSPGDRIVAGTDGLAEQENADGDQYSYDEFERINSVAVDHDAEQLLDHLFDTVKAFGDGKPADDDRTAFIVERISG